MSKRAKGRAVPAYQTDPTPLETTNSWPTADAPSPTDPPQGTARPSQTRRMSSAHPASPHSSQSNPGRPASPAPSQSDPGRPAAPHSSQSDPGRLRTSPAPDTGRSPFSVPLDPHSPWPKWKRDVRQTGRSPNAPRPTGDSVWEFKTELGVFSSAVFDAQENVYIGSGDHVFYCFRKDGTVKWTYKTGEIVDSAALLDDAGRVFVASCDGWVYALNREDGSLLWSFQSDTIEQCHAKGVKSFVDWFEGHISVDPAGTLVIPNDNFHIYGLDRETGEQRWAFITDDQTWSCPALNPETKRLFVGTNYYVRKNQHAVDSVTGERIWTAGTLGSMVASPLLTGEGPEALVVAAGFDGLVRAFYQKTGKQVWKFGARDHFYASPVEAADGTIIQPAVDGTVYALDPTDGTLRWSFDTPEPIRSTPAIDGDGNIYFGNGEGKLYCIDGHGAFRWSYRCVTDERSDVNASPALSAEAVVVGGDDGTILRIPLDYAESPLGRDDPRCERAAEVRVGGVGAGNRSANERRGTGGGVENAGTSVGAEAPGASVGAAKDGAALAVDAALYLLSRYGKRLDEPPELILANQPLTMTLVVREGDTAQTALIDKRSVVVTTDPPVRLTSAVSADKRFVTIIPKEMWAPAQGGTLTITVSGRYKTRPRRFGLKMFGGKTGGGFEETFRFSVDPRNRRIGSVSIEAGRSPDRYPFVIPDEIACPKTVLEVGRLAPAMPTILPSYNQLGFDSIHYHLGFLHGDEHRALLWGVGAKLVGGGTEQSVVDPELGIRFAIWLDYDGGLVTLVSEEGFTLEFNGWDMPFDLFRFATKVRADYGAEQGRLDGDTSNGARQTQDTGSTISEPVNLEPAFMNAVVRCDDIKFYGPFLKALGVSDFRTGLMHVSGAAGRVRDLGVQNAPDLDAFGKITVTREGNSVVARFAGASAAASDHNYGVLLLEAGRCVPVPLNYTKITEVCATAEGAIQEVRLHLPAGWASRSAVRTDRWWAIGTPDRQTGQWAARGDASIRGRVTARGKVAARAGVWAGARAKKKLRALVMVDTHAISEERL